MFIKSRSVTSALIATALMVLSRAAPAEAQTFNGPLYSTEQLAGFDILGVKLRMGLGEVVDELVERNYAIKFSQGDGREYSADAPETDRILARVCTFTRAVMVEINKRRRQAQPGEYCGPNLHIIGVSPNGRVDVAFGPDTNSSGIGVIHISLTFINADIPSLRENLISKYGPVSSIDYRTYRWSTRFNPLAPSPRLYANVHDPEEHLSSSVTLDGRLWQTAIADQEVLAEADRVAPPRQSEF